MSPSQLAVPESQPFESLLSLRGRCAVVTGGSRGIGEAIVHRLTEAGAAVVFTGRGVEALKRVEAAVKAKGGTAVGVQADVGKLEDSRRVMALAVEQFGRLDILVNNAASFPPATTLEMTEALWDETFDTDAKGAFFAAKFAAESMIAAGNGGRIINILSTAAFRPAAVFTAYGAAKSALWYATQVMAQELAEHKIIVNAVTPGSTMTAERIAAFSGEAQVGDVWGANVAEQAKNLQGVMMQGGGFANMIAKMMPLGRTGFPDDIAKAVLFLASEMGAYISGVNITVDGGQTLRLPDPGGDLDDDNKSGTVAPAERASSALVAASGDVVIANALNGKFKAGVKTPMGSQEVIFDLHVVGETLVGTASIAGKSADIENGRVTLDGFALDYRFRTPMGKVKVQVSGKLEGDKIAGILKTPMGNIPFEGTRMERAG